MIIDAHQHFWMIGRNDHEWPGAELEAIHRDYGPEDLKAASFDIDLTGSVLVQSQPSEIDTLWLLEVAARSNLVKGVVGWTDLLAVNAPDRIAYLAAQPKFKGLRPMLQGLPEDDWILQDGLKPAFQAMLRDGLSLDALVFTRHLPHIRVLAERYPELAIIIDHAAKPPLARQASHPELMQAWREGMSELVDCSNITVKLSGLFTEMNVSQSPDEAIPCVDFILERFGPNRVMWGSDWPVLNLRRSYRFWFDWISQHLCHHNPEARDAIFGGTCRKVYRLDIESVTKA